MKIGLERDSSATPLLPVPVSASVTTRSAGDTGSCHLRSNNTEQPHIGQSKPQVELEKIAFLANLPLRTRVLEHGG